MNESRSSPYEVFYWREGGKEVDFVLKHQDEVIAIEVKSGLEPLRSSGIDSFVEQFHPKKVLLIGEKGIPVETFLKGKLSSFC